MNREETKKIVRVIMAAFPNWHPDNLSDVIDAWSMFLDEYDYNNVAKAVKAYTLTNTSGFAPSIGQIVGMMQKIEQPEELGEMEAWSLVSKAIRNGGYNYQEEFEKMPELVKKAIGSAEQIHRYAIDESYNESVVQSHFRSAYRIVCDRTKELNRLPESMQISINEHAYGLLEDGDKD